MQLIECRAYAKRNDYAVIHEYIDEHLLGNSDKRPAFLQMIEDSKRRQFNYIIVYQLDRFARNRYDSATYKRKLQKNNVRVLSARENISEDASVILMESVLEGMAEYYSAELSQKVMRGQRISAEKCKYLGGLIPFGYKINKETMNYEVDEDQLPLVKQIFEQYAAGSSIKKILDMLNASGVITSRNNKWNKNSLTSIITNKKYIGIYTYKNIEIPDGVPALIDINLFEAAQRRRIMKNNRNFNNAYLLSNKVICGTCNSQVNGESGTSKSGKTYYYYKCLSRKLKTSDCKCPTLKKDYLENVVLQAIYDFIHNDDLIHKIALEVEASAIDDELVKTIDLCHVQLKDCEHSIANLVKAIENGMVSPTINERLAELERDRNDLRYRYELYTLMNKKMDADKIAFWIDNLSHSVKEEDKQQLIDIFVNKVIVYVDKIVVVFNYSNETRQLTLNNEDICEIDKKLTENDKIEHKTCSISVVVVNGIVSNPN